MTVEHNTDGIRLPRNACCKLRVIKNRRVSPHRYRVMGRAKLASFRTGFLPRNPLGLAVCQSNFPVKGRGKLQGNAGPLYHGKLLFFARRFGQFLIFDKGFKITRCTEIFINRGVAHIGYLIETRETFHD